MTETAGSEAGALAVFIRRVRACFDPQSENAILLGSTASHPGGFMGYLVHESTGVVLWAGSVDRPSFSFFKR